MPGSDLVMPGSDRASPVILSAAKNLVMPGSDLVMPGSDRASHPHKTTHSAFGAQNAHRVARPNQTTGNNGPKCRTRGMSGPDDRQKKPILLIVWLNWTRSTGILDQVR